MFGQNVQVEIKEEQHQIKGWTFPSSNRGSVNLATFCQNRGWVPFPVSALGIALICELWVRRLHRERGSRWHERARLTGSKIWIPTQATKASIGICSVVLVFLILWAGKLAIKRIKTSAWNIQLRSWALRRISPFPHSLWSHPQRANSLSHARRCGHGYLINVCDVPDPKGNGVNIKLVIVEGQFFRISQYPGKSWKRKAVLASAWTAVSSAPRELSNLGRGLWEPLNL